ncbi:hypothetical protein Tco_0718775 [Tanacetum coccineum]
MASILSLVAAYFQWLALCFLLFMSAFLTQGTISSKSIIFSWGGSISPEGFLSSFLLWLVICVAVVGVGVTVVVVIIVAVVVVVESSSVGQNFRFLRFIRGVVILVTSLNTWRVIPDETLHHFLRLWHHSGTLRLPILESSTMSGDHSFQSDGKIRLPSSGLQFEDSTSLSKVS